MNRDVDKIIAQLQAAYPDIQVEQLRVVHPDADDDGVWFFRHPSGRGEVQIESTDGTVPFLIENAQDPTRATGRSVDETVSLVARYLGLRSGAA